MKIVVDTSRDITQLFNLISKKIPDILLENYIVISHADVKIKKELATIIADYITDKYETEISRKYIKPFELLKEDSIKVITCLLDDENLKNKRKSLIEKEIYGFLSTGHINIDGVVNFRLSKYKKELYFTLDFLIDEVSNKRSYDEFISLMKYFTEIQPAMSDTVILEEKAGEYCLTDSSGKPIELKFDNEFAEEIMPVSLTGEEMLISNLMAVMPEEIIFNNIDENKPIINTIKQIFDGRISVGKEIKPCE